MLINIFYNAFMYDICGLFVCMVFYSEPVDASESDRAGECRSEGCAFRQFVARHAAANDDAIFHDAAADAFDAAILSSSSARHDQNGWHGRHDEWHDGEYGRHDAIGWHGYVYERPPSGPRQWTSSARCWRLGRHGRHGHGLLRLLGLLGLSAELSLSCSTCSELSSSEEEFLSDCSDIIGDS